MDDTRVLLILLNIAILISAYAGLKQSATRYAEVQEYCGYDGVFTESYDVDHSIMYWMRW